MIRYYHMDLSKFSLDEFQQIIENYELQPSRRNIKENTVERFEKLKSMGIRNLKNLVDELASVKKIDQFAERSAIPREYLEILKRQTKIYVPVPFKLGEIPDVDDEVIRKLAGAGISNTKQLYECQEDTHGLAQRLHIDEGDLVDLVHMTDLARAGWVGPILVRLFHSAGVVNLQTLAEEDAQAIFDKLCEINRRMNYTKAGFTVNDIRSCIDLANILIR